MKPVDSPSALFKDDKRAREKLPLLVVLNPNPLMIVTMVQEVVAHDLINNESYCTKRVEIRPY